MSHQHLSGAALLVMAAGHLTFAGLSAASTLPEASCSSQKCSDAVLLVQTKPGVLSTARQLHTEDRQPKSTKPRGRCAFVQEPETPHYWDPKCKLGMLGCWADGVSAECRFCGEAPYTGIPCPRDARAGSVSICAFVNWPVEKVYWEPDCKDGTLGCLADGKHLGCRYCGGKGAYSGIKCPRSTTKACTFDTKPVTPYFWDPSCKPGDLGCKADGIHRHCRFCAARPFESIPCPDPLRPPANQCVFKNEPRTGYYWDAECQMGILGCWADGIHAECRFCGGTGAYASIPCPKK